MVSEIPRKAVVRCVNVSCVCQSLDVAAAGRGALSGECYGALRELVTQCDRLGATLRRHQRAAADVDRRKSEWRAVALVLDRLMLVSGQCLVIHWSVAGQWSLTLSCSIAAWSVSVSGHCLVLDRLLLITFFAVTCAACVVIFSSVIVPPTASLLH